ncbi:MAG: iron ABC transporter permease [Clostridia bacterium]
MNKCKVRVRVLFLSLTTALLATMVIALLFGSTKTGLQDLLNLLTTGGDPSVATIIFDVRLPRVLMAAITGMGLALVGAVYQGFFRNPMADPFMLGMSSGAAFGASVAIVLGLESALFFGMGFVSVFAFVGAALTSVAVYLVANSGYRRQKVTILLAGIAISFFLSAFVSLFMVFSHGGVQKIVFWTMGGLGGASMDQLIVLFPAVLIGSVGLLFFSRDLNVLALGEDTARSLGVEVERMNLPILALSSLVIAVCVSFTGVIGFVGLIIPHMIRLISGPDHRTLLPLSALGGGLFMVIADLLARTVAAPAEIPVGAITALVGSPYFIWLLLRSGKGGVLK